ncbi:hypothetical protein ACJ41O_006947 [Fusarium nematophilum]
MDQTKPTIRLLLLQPGAYKDPLVGNLVEVELEAAEGTYTALSYGWGSSDDPDRLLVDGGYFKITPNLDRALRHLRSRSTVRKTWVDAVCINQFDVMEKMNQVPLMSIIYRHAEMVFSFLGEATPSSAIGMDILSFLTSNQHFDDGSPWNRLPTEEVADGLQDILQRAYFKRIWIVQEAALGRRVRMQVGSVSIEWDGESHTRRFLTRIKLLEVSPTWQAAAELRGIDLRPVRELLERSVAYRDKERAGVGQPATTFLDLVHAMRHMQSTDPRDKIFGLMGLVSPAEVAGFEPDYTQSWEGTYRRFFGHVYHTALQDPHQEW